MDINWVRSAIQSYRVRCIRWRLRMELSSIRIVPIRRIQWRMDSMYRFMRSSTYRQRIRRQAPAAGTMAGRSPSAFRSVSRIHSMCWIMSIISAIPVKTWRQQLHVRMQQSVAIALRSVLRAIMRLFWLSQMQLYLMRMRKLSVKRSIRSVSP